MHLRSRTSFVLAFALGCCSSAPRALSSLCGIEAVDTAGWREVTSRYGRFAIFLPANATEPAVRCFDSQCGMIRVGDWSISYDSGPHGSGDRVRADTGEVGVQPCNFRLSGRTVSVAVGRYSIDPRIAWYGKITESSWAGDLVAHAAMPLSNEAGGVNMSMHSKQAIDRAVFLTAVQTLRVVQPKKSGSESRP
jgi:hypothetical protein